MLLDLIVSLRWYIGYVRKPSRELNKICVLTDEDEDLRG